MELYIKLEINTKGFIITLMKIENPIMRIPAKQQRFEVVKFRNLIMIQARTQTIRELELRIAENEFRKPVRIIGEWHIRPFWRDGKKVPSLPMSSSADPYLRGHF